jgi:hypothetical protein
MPALKRSPFLRLAALGGTLLAAGCGYVGDPLPPALNLPKVVADLRATEHGDRLVVDFTIPDRTTEDLPLKRVTQVDLRIWPNDNQPFTMERMLAASNSVPATATAPGPVKVELPAAAWVGKEVFFVVRTFGPRRRPSDWSNMALLTVVPPLATPAGVKAEATGAGVRLTWQYPPVPDLSFRIYRALGKDDTELLDLAPQSGWVDAKSEFGKDYRYQIQAVRKAGQGDAESLPSEPVAIRPADAFPPAVPRSLAGIPGLRSVELTWEPNVELDFACYRVYRAVGGGSFERLADKIAAPALSDRQVESGKPYRYQVSAVDRLGNESERTAPVEVTAP